MSAALLLGDTNYSEAPARRALMGLTFGVMLALLIGVAFWVYGLINPGGNTAWADAATDTPAGPATPLLTVEEVGRALGQPVTVTLR